MIPLDDSAWNELSHCYGDGSDIPPKLAKVDNSKSLPKSFWDDLTNTLCHQCTIGTASIAAVSHLVRIAGNDPNTKKATDCMFLAALIITFALGPNNRLPKMEKRLSSGLDLAIADGRRLLMQMYDQKRRTLEANMRYMSMIAAFDKRADISSLLGEICLGWYDCPKCEEKIKIEELCTW